MLNKIWCFFIFIAIAYGLLKGTIMEVNHSIFESIQSTMTLTIQLCGSMCFWNGIMNIAKHTHFNDYMNSLLKPIISFFFNDIEEDSKCYQNISMNITSNLLGLGNSATPCGLKAMEEMQKRNTYPNRLTNDQFLFILMNTASIQLIPTTIITVRTALNSKNPAGIILGVWFSSMITFCVMMLIAKKYCKIRKK